MYLVIGDAEGTAIRQAVWQRHEDTWQHREEVHTLAAALGVSRKGYEELQRLLPCWLPSTTDPAVQDKVCSAKKTTPGSAEDTGKPWISFADVTDLIEKHLDSRSDPVRPGHQEKDDH